MLTRKLQKQHIIIEILFVFVGRQTYVLSSGEVLFGLVVQN